MKHKLYSVLLTALLGMFGMNAWAQDYEISNAEDLAAFAQAVNGGETTANAVLTDDIDMSTLESWTAIGDWNTGAVTSAYCGHFDGQGHTIFNFNFTSNKNYFGIFGVVSSGCLIENLVVKGTITTNIATAGVVGYARDATPTLRNIHSYLNINNTRAGSRLGGILGSSVNGTIIVDRCTYSGTMDGNDAGGSGNYGGIVGYVNNNANAHLRVTNCLFDGKLNNTAAAPGTCTFGGMVGYVGASPDVTIDRCLSIGKLQSQITGQFYGAVKHNTCSIVRSYYQGTNINGSASTVTPTTQQVTEVSDDELKSGKICFELNDNQYLGWFQKLKNRTFVAEQYVVTTNGTSEEPTITNIYLIDAIDGTFTFTLPDFILKIIGKELHVGTISLEGITIKNDGTFENEGTYDVPDENIPSELSAFKDNFKNIPYTLTGKVNDDDNKFYAVVDLTVLGNTVNVVSGEDNFTAAAPTGEEYPTPNGTALVYANGSFNCDGTPKEGSIVVYSNTNSSIIDPHDFADGFCSVCGAFDETYMAANEEGFFEIGAANQLKWFAIYVNQVDPAVNAILTADINLYGERWTPIGKGVTYGGTFDGQNFTISNLYYTGSGNYNGLFGQVENATIKNFSIGGTLVCADSGNGVIGWSKNSSVSNIHSTLTIDATTGTLHHTAGIVGSANVSTTVDRCSFSGTITVNADSYDCFGGIVGYTNEYCKVSNCVNYGTINFAAANCYAGGIIGYINSTACYGAHNCLNVGDVNYTGEGDPTYSGAIVGRLRGNNPDLWGDSYYKQGSAAQGCGENQIPTNFEVSAEKLASGEVAFKLGTAFGQEIGVDDTPVLGGKKVYELAGTISNFDGLNIESAYGDAACILPSLKYDGAYKAYTNVAQADYDFGDWNTSNPNYNVIIGTPAEQDGKAWFTPGYDVTAWNYGQDLPEFGDGRPADVYAVRYFTVEGDIPATLYMPAPHDDAPCEYYINGVKVFAETDGWYEDEVVRLTDEQKALIKTDGSSVNVFAFHVHQNWGGRYADGGLYTAGDPVDAFNNDGNKAAIDATIAIMEAQGIGAEEIEYAKGKSNYRGGMSAGLAQLRKARRIAADARTENFAGTAPADGMIAYIYNVGAKMFLAGGNDWGTHASLNHMGAKCVLHANSSGANRYAIQTNLPNGRRGANDGLGHNGYVDCGYGDDFTTVQGWAWEFKALEDGTYNIINADNNLYLGMTDDDRLQVDTDKAADNPYNAWIFVTPEEFEALAADATETAPVDLGHLIHQATFSQNDFDGDEKDPANAELSRSAWERNAGGIWNWKGNSAGGDYMFEAWNTAAVGKVYLKQVVEGLPAGKYTVSMSGYYRDGNFESADEGNVRNLAYLYAGTEDNCVALQNIVDGSGNCPGYGRGGASGIVIPDGCYDAAKYFQVGTYTNTIDAVVGADGKLEIGVYRDAEDVKGGDWITTDNWRLYYQGNPVQVTVTDAGYATFVAPGHITTLPEGVEAFAAQVGAGYVHLEPVTAIPAGEAVVLKAAEGTYAMKATAFSAELGTTNDLKAATEEVTADGTQYILAKQDEAVGFAKATPETKIAAGKGYLVIGGAGVKAFYPFADDATGISTIDNAQLTIDNEIYNLAGQRVSKMQKGINIVNGKKVLK